MFEGAIFGMGTYTLPECNSAPYCGPSISTVRKIRTARDQLRESRSGSVSMLLCGFPLMSSVFTVAVSFSFYRAPCQLVFLQDRMANTDRQAHLHSPTR